MSKFVVEQKYYDNGKVVANIIQTENPEKFETFKSTLKCDIWADVFDTIDEALRFRDEALKA